MAYQKLTDLGTDQVFALGAGEGKKPRIEGYYLGSRTVTTTNGDSVIHVFQTPKGNEGVWGTKKLNDNLGASNRGVMTLIEYKGKIKLQGGKTQHTYEFMVDRDNTIEVTNLPSGSATAGVELTDADDNSNDDAVEAEFQQAQAAAASAAARQARVQGMLNKDKKQA